MEYVKQVRLLDTVCERSLINMIINVRDVVKSHSGKSKSKSKSKSSDSEIVKSKSKSTGREFKSSSSPTPQVSLSFDLQPKKRQNLSEFSTLAVTNYSRS